MNWYIVGRGCLGMVILLGLAWVFSRDRRHIQWGLVGKGILFIVGLALVIFKVPPVRMGMDMLSTLFMKLVDFSDEGAAFVFGDLVKDTKSYGYIFAFHVLPNTIFFSAFSALLYHYKLLPKVVQGFAWMLTRAFKLSGAECLVAAANIFLGQIASPILVKPYLPKLGKAEMFSMMTSGMATISGSVMLGVVAILGGENEVMREQIANYLLTASILNAPCALLVAHIMCPKVGQVDRDMHMVEEVGSVNAFDAVVQGTEDGLRVALSIGGILIVFTGLICMANWVLADGVGEWLGVNSWVGKWTCGYYDGLTLQAILGTLFAPVAWIVGVDSTQLMAVGQLLGEKVVLNEFVAYISMGEMMRGGVLVDERTVMLAAYALCSFANLTSIGVQISGFGALAGNQRMTVSKMAVYAVVSGNIACLVSTCLAGILF